MIDLSNFDLDKLPSVSFCSRKNLPHVRAVYFAISRWGEVLYIGKAMWLRKRWQSHNLASELDYLGCSKIAWIEFEDTLLVSSHLRKIESFFIKKYDPLLNTPIGKHSRKNSIHPVPLNNKGYYQPKGDKI